MSLMTNPLVMRCRGVARRLGLLSLVRRGSPETYELQVARLVDSAIRAGGVVWDVGANAGHYTTRFSQLVGPEGKVFAFEPSPVARASLAAAVSGMPNVSILAVALSDTNGHALLTAESDDYTYSGSIVAGATGQRTDTIETVRGDQIASTIGVPTFVKIDTEGHELSVLQGMRKVLADPRLRDLIVEVHFAVLTSAGDPGAPARIEQLLRDSGLLISWLNTSHLHARRP